MSVKEDFCFKYLPKEEFERILLKVQQSRQEKKDEMRWQQYLAQLNKTTTESNEDIKLDTGSSSSSDTEAIKVTKVKPKLKIKKTEALPALESETKLTTIEQHVKTKKSIVKVQSGIQSLLASIGAQIETVQHVDSEDESEHMSARSVKLRHVRLAEFNARFRRNYIYPLQLEVDKCSELVNNLSSNSQAAPSNVSYQLSLRSIEKAHTRAFQALQIFQRQYQGLKELLTNSVLLEDLLAQLSSLSQISSSFGLPNKFVDDQRRTLSQQVAQHMLQEDMARLGLSTARKKPSSTMSTVTATKSKWSTKKLPARPAQRGQLLRNKSRIKQAKPRVRIETWTKGEQLPAPLVVNSEEVIEEVTLPQTSAEGGASIHSAAPQVCHPVNVRVLMLQHQPVTSEKVDLQDAGTQTSMLQSCAVGPDEPTISDQEVDAVTTEDSFSKLSPVLPKISSNMFTSKLQQAVLSELAGKTNHLGPLIDQLLREEFL